MLSFNLLFSYRLRTMLFEIVWVEEFWLVLVNHPLVDTEVECQRPLATANGSV
jgi:hypothetical protein